MRILLTVATMAVGGAERVVVELAKGLGEDGDEVAIAADRGALDPAATETGAGRFVTPGYGRSPITAARGALGLRRAMRSFRPDVINSHNVKSTAMVAAARASIGARPPLVATFHGVRQKEYRAAAQVFRAARRVVCVSEEVARGLVDAGLRPDQVLVIPNGVSAPQPLTAPVRESIDTQLGLDGRPVVAMVGRLAPVKAPHRFLAAAALIAAEIPDCCFLVVGDGPLRGSLEDDAKALGIGGSVRFTGMRSDARALIARSDVLVSSSDSEGMSLVTLEALGAGTPVVAAAVEGMEEVLGGGAGVLVDRDAPALARAVIDLVREPERRAEMGRIGREKVQNEHSLDVMIRAYRDLYSELASGDPLLQR
jgi:glycosyltransferase involved in cell wall biosynthesis